MSTVSAALSQSSTTSSKRDQPITVCWDIDGTLIAKTSGTFDLYLKAISAIVGYDVGPVDAPHHGMTDLQIIRLYLSKLGIKDNIAPLVVKWLDNQAGIIYNEAQIKHRALPGTLEALRAVYAAGHRNVLLTGNSEIRARYKLDEARIPTAFFCWPDSGFGHLYYDRNELARSVARRIGGPALVIGDTPADEECARTAGMSFLGVGTGSFHPTDLARNGSLAVPDLVTGLPVLIDSLIQVRL